MRDLTRAVCTRVRRGVIDAMKQNGNDPCLQEQTEARTMRAIFNESCTPLGASPPTTVRHEPRRTQQKIRKAQHRTNAQMREQDKPRAQRRAEEKAKAMGAASSKSAQSKQPTPVVRGARPVPAWKAAMERIEVDPAGQPPPPPKPLPPALSAPQWVEATARGHDVGPCPGPRPVGLLPCFSPQPPPEVQTKNPPPVQRQGKSSRLAPVPKAELAAPQRAPPKDAPPFIGPPPPAKKMPRSKPKPPLAPPPAEPWPPFSVAAHEEQVERMKKAEEAKANMMLQTAPPKAPPPEALLSQTAEVPAAHDDDDDDDTSSAEDDEPMGTGDTSPEAGQYPPEEVEEGIIASEALRPPPKSTDRGPRCCGFRRRAFLSAAGGAVLFLRPLWTIQDILGVPADALVSQRRTRATRCASQSRLRRHDRRRPGVG